MVTSGPCERVDGAKNYVIVVAGATDPLGFSGDLSAQLAHLLLAAVHKDGIMVKARVMSAQTLSLVLHQSPINFVATSEMKKSSGDDHAMAFQWRQAHWECQPHEVVEVQPVVVAEACNG